MADASNYMGGSNIPSKDNKFKARLGYRRHGAQAKRQKSKALYGVVPSFRLISVCFPFCL